MFIANRKRLSVLIGAESLLLRRSGVGRMTLEITRAARKTSGIDRVELLVGDVIANARLLDQFDDSTISRLTDPEVTRKPRPWKIAIGRLPGVQALRRIKNGELSRKIHQLARDTGNRIVYHEPNMITQAITLPTVVTMNDLSWHHHPSWHPAERLSWIDRNINRTLRQATRFAAISEFTKAAVIREFGIGAELIDVLPLAPAPEFVPVGRARAAAVLERHGLTDCSYVFSTSTIEPRKNFDRLLKAYLRLPPALRDRVPLVIAGGRGWGDVLTRPDAERAIRTGQVRMLGHVPDSELPMLCSRAGVVAYVSLYEGFGLPVVEAMATGAPVMASKTTAVGELAAGAAALVDPLDIGDMAAKLLELLEDQALADRLRAAGLVRAGQYSWDRTMARLQQVWERALD